MTAVFAEKNAPGRLIFRSNNTNSKPIGFVYSPLWKITHRELIGFVYSPLWSHPPKPIGFMYSPSPFEKSLFLVGAYFGADAYSGMDVSFRDFTVR